MRKLEVTEIVKRHIRWVKGVRGGQPADLSLRDLRPYKFDRIILRKAKLAGANMTRCSMKQADLSDCDMFSIMLDVEFDRARLSESEFEGVFEHARS